MKENTAKTASTSEPESGYPIELKLLVVGIVVGLAILVMELSGMFSGGQ